MKNIYFLHVIFLLLFASFSTAGFSIEPPYLPPVPDQTALLGQPFTLDINAINADPAETYELTDSRPGMTIDPVTGIISWTPAKIDDGGLVTVRAYNTAGESTRSFDIYLSNAIECPTGLLSYWKLDSLVGDTVYPDYANGFYAKTTLALMDTTGMVDSAQVFKPVTKKDEFLEVADSAEHAWARSDNFSFSLWFKYNGNNLNNNQVLIGKGLSLMGYSMILVSIDNTVSPAKLRFELKNKTADPGGAVTLTSSTDIQTDQWYHVVAEYAGAPDPDPVTMRLYVNNVKDEMVVSTFDGSGFTGNGDLSIGYWNAYIGTNTYPFNGVLDEVSLFGKALSDTEVDNMFTAGQNGLPLCRPGNYAPQITSEPVLTATQDQPYSYTVTAKDYENDPLTLTAEILPTWLSFNGSSGLLSGTPGNDNVGDTLVNIMVTDGNIEIHQEFTISVANVNDAPVITSVPEDTVISQGDTFHYVFAASDIDQGDNVTLTAPVLPSWISFDPATGTLDGTATNDQVHYSADSTFSVELQATDNSGVSTTQTFTVRVVNVNDPPQVVSQNTVSTDRNVGVTVSLSDLTIEDPDTHPADLEMILYPGDNYTVDGNTITPDLNFYGDLTVNTQVTDQVDTVDFELAVTVNFVNIKPEFSSTPVTSATEGSVYTYLVEATDVDVGDPNQNQTLTYTAETLPGWLTFNQDNNVLVGIPTNADVGDANVSIGVSDGIDIVYQTFTITVANVNDPPVITGQQTVTGIKNQSVEITIDDLIVTDPDNQVTDMTVIVLDGDNYTHDGNTVTFAQDFTGDLSVNVKVNDGQDDSNIFALTVTVGTDGVPSLTGHFVNRVYPNPASDYVVFELSSTTARFIEVRDLAGKVVILKKLESGTREYRLSVSDLSKGIYIYRIYNDNRYQTGKLLVE
ncbi:MAG TPA: putative Ig domain-containing protein [Bacteroidales bacterium]|nr:putative Ig domain-containing protein [Bacteroidales bacterium]